MDLLSGLNAEQKEAVLHNEGPLLILAGAGSGKTRVLTHRIAYLIEQHGVYPSNILAITFTNKAAREMKERIAGLIGDLSNDMWVGTFHSICIRILRRDIEKLGYDRSFVIYDTQDQQVVIKECLKELNLNDKNFPPKSVLETIGKQKDELIDAEQYEKQYASDFRMGKIAKVYKLYEKKLKANNALDFDDIIMNTIKLFERHPEVLEYYQRRFRYILVDEYQDTNTAQYTLVRKMSQAHENLCVVGDDDQSIYGWRGANIRNILDFEKDFKKCCTIKLEQNYRSTQNILDAANHVIGNNTGRKNKSLWTDNKGGSKIVICENDNEHEEALYTAREIQRIISDEDRKYKDFAVLYRINAQSRVLEEMFMREGIPYKIVGGQKFYDRKEIKDIIAYMRLVQNPGDNVSLKRVINVPKRGIGDATVENAEVLAYQTNVSLFTVISNTEEFPSLKRAAQKLGSFSLMINKFRTMKENMSISQLLDVVVEDSGILREYELENTVEAQSRIENIKELKSVALEFEKQSEDNSLEEFLAHISLVSDIDSLQEDQDYVVLMTMHSAKGLEFPVVFIPGLEEGVFPGYRAITEGPEQLEEERRLCYVGITRAREKLYMSNARFRTLFGNSSYNRPSRFLAEIPEELVEYPFKSSGSFSKPKETQVWGKSSGTSKSISATTSSTPAGSGSLKDLINSNLVTRGFGGSSAGTAVKSPAGQQINSFGRSIPMKPSSGGSNTSDDFSVGDKVEHKKFGKGTISKATADSGDQVLEIQFEGAGMKRLMASMANLKRL
ncbi:ATP-dependent DNA helicase PcrA [Ruminiclostridium papyrosolvens DSM 2782]|uniref:ATP-dependent DNA helicase n=1 Tax=Ruminiclostridium papyrosolvens DSM 2782 TaxID=588581 RepID=F1TE13_9FIRM|nr:DNA helicase PcrA [Ruminiclostridium papyrosolvens]EGD47459.1 ATP-dependent DNA helicase PcrA [Ruminiclostridium papyrosolvens DSM 2782]WES34804.1 DNA helicase PcrA [Ruminiclostridium papyrosolvens DSM 2782]